MPENNPPGAVIIVLTATDHDLPDSDNSKVTYFLPPELAALFAIDPSDGVLSTKVTLDRERTPFYQFKVFAMDSGKPQALTSTAQISLTLLDVNDEKPQLLTGSYFFGVEESWKEESGDEEEVNDDHRHDDGRVVMVTTHGNASSAEELELELRHRHRQQYRDQQQQQQHHYQQQQQHRYQRQWQQYNLEPSSHRRPIAVGRFEARDLDAPPYDRFFFELLPEGWNVENSFSGSQEGRLIKKMNIIMSK